MDTIKLAPSQSRTIQIASQLLDPSEAKFIAFPFELGRQNEVFYGNPTVIKTHTTLLDALPPEELSRGPRLATLFDINEKTLPGMTLAWLYLNGIVDVGNMEGNTYSLFDKIVALNLLDYFDVIEPNINKFYQYLSNSTRNITLEQKFDQDTKTLLKDRYLKNPKGYDDFKMSLLFDVIPPGWTVEKINEFVQDAIDHYQRNWGLAQLVPKVIDEILALPFPLTDFQKEWIQIFLRYKNLLNTSTAEKLQRKWAGLEPEEPKVETKTSNLIYHNNPNLYPQPGILGIGLQTGNYYTPEEFERWYGTEALRRAQANGNQSLGGIQSLPQYPPGVQAIQPRGLSDILRETQQVQQPWQGLASLLQQS